MNLDDLSSSDFEDDYVVNAIDPDSDSDTESPLAPVAPVAPVAPAVDDSANAIIQLLSVSSSRNLTAIAANVFKDSDHDAPWTLDMPTLVPVVTELEEIDSTGAVGPTDVAVASFDVDDATSEIVSFRIAAMKRTGVGAGTANGRGPIGYISLPLAGTANDDIVAINVAQYAEELRVVDVGDAVNIVSGARVRQGEVVAKDAAVVTMKYDDGQIEFDASRFPSQSFYVYPEHFRPQPSRQHMIVNRVFALGRRSREFLELVPEDVIMHYIKQGYTYSDLTTLSPYWHRHISNALMEHIFKILVKRADRAPVRFHAHTPVAAKPPIPTVCASHAPPLTEFRPRSVQMTAVVTSSDHGRRLAPEEELVDEQGVFGAAPLDAAQPADAAAAASSMADLDAEISRVAAINIEPVLKKQILQLSEIVKNAKTLRECYRAAIVIIAQFKFPIVVLPRAKPNELMEFPQNRGLATMFDSKPAELAEAYAQVMKRLFKDLESTIDQNRYKVAVDNKKVAATTTAPAPTPAPALKLIPKPRPTASKKPQRRPRQTAAAANANLATFRKNPAFAKDPKLASANAASAHFQTARRAARFVGRPADANYCTFIHGVLIAVKAVLGRVAYRHAYAADTPEAKAVRRCGSEAPDAARAILDAALAFTRYVPSDPEEDKFILGYVLSRVLDALDLACPALATFVEERVVDVMHARYVQSFESIRGAYEDAREADKLSKFNQYERFDPAHKRAVRDAMRVGMLKPADLRERRESEGDEGDEGDEGGSDMHRRVVQDATPGRDEFDDDGDSS